MADSAFVQDLRANPLMLSLMCGIYATENYIPRNRPDVYEKCALLLFDSWDKQRGIKAPLSFDAHVQAAMRSLALWLYPQQASQQGLPRAKLISYMKKYLMRKRFDDEEEAENAATEFIDFCKGRAWVLTDVGAELYGFTHRTFLEYFAASQIIRENADPAKLFEYLIPRLRSGGWEVVAQLALQVLNKAVEDGADNFLEILLAYADTDVELSLKWKLLAFATQALTYIVPRPPVLQAMTVQVVEFCRKYRGTQAIDGLDSHAPIDLLLGASAENLRLVSKYLYDHLAGLLEEDPSDSIALSIALYADVFAAAGSSQGGSYSVGDNVSFWNRQVKDHLGRFNTAVESQKVVHSWVAFYLLEHGHCSTAEVLARYGPEAFFGIGAGSELGGLMFPLVWRILLSEARQGTHRSVPLEDTEMTAPQIDELKEALLDLPPSWFTAEKPTSLPGLVGFVLSHLREGQSRRISNSALLLLMAAVHDFGEESVTHRAFTNRVARPSPDVGLAALVRTLTAREVALGRSDLDSHSLFDSQEQLFEMQGDEVFSRRLLAAAGIDERTMTLMEAWVADPNFKIVRVTSSKRRAARRVSSGRRPR
jgi:hypothetical protein